MLSDDESDEAPLQPSRDKRKKKKKKKSKQLTYGEMPEKLGEGFFLLHAMGKRVCFKCIRKVLDSTAEFFTTPP